MKRKLVGAWIYVIIAGFVPYVSVKAFNLLDRLPYWNNRVS